MKKQKKIHHILQSGDEAKEMKQSTTQVVVDKKSNKKPKYNQRGMSML